MLHGALRVPQVGLACNQNMSGFDGAGERLDLRPG